MQTDVVPRRYRPADAVGLTTLLHRAYGELGASGLDFTAATQDVDTTRRRVAGGVCWVVEHDGAVAATMTMSVPPPDDVRQLSGSARVPATGWLCQVAVGAEFRGRGVARVLFDTVRAHAVQVGITTIGLDTAVPAAHLAVMYSRWGFRHVDTVSFPDKSYDSVVMTMPVG